ncbi:MAG: ATP-binding cassette domain-containing protein [Fusobacteria bacterium]|nr:ATP-binding cassette domain-containing protein [Fusobacteriota bacterium]
MLSIKRLSFEYEKIEVFNELDFSIEKGERVVLLGENGRGKSTLLKLIAGKLSYKNGKIHVSGRVNIGYMPQEINPFNHLTGSEFLESVSGVKECLIRVEKALENYIGNPKEYEVALEQAVSMEAFTFELRVDEAIKNMKLEKEILTRKIATYSGGEKTRLCLMGILISKYDLYLLDEPTNNLDFYGLELLEEFIKNSSSSFIIVSHDKRFIINTRSRIVELCSSSEVKSYNLGFDEYLECKLNERKSVEEKYQEYVENIQKIRTIIHKKRRAIESTERSKCVKDGNKIAFNNHKEKVIRNYGNSLNAYSKKLDRLEVVEQPDRIRDMSFKFSLDNSKRSKRLFNIERVFVQYEDRELGPYNFELESQERVIITGENGSGKSTLLKLLTKEIMPYMGSIKVAPYAKIGYINQEYKFKFEEKSVIENITIECQISVAEGYNLLARFNIKKDKADGLPHELTPGQRARALLASMAIKRVNVLILDEPTNHLDMMTSYELQKAIKSFQGALIVVTHDRDLIEAIENKRVFEIK